jgi:gliding motility-associated-like protein
MKTDFPRYHLLAPARLLILVFIMAFLYPLSLSAQGRLQAGVRNTNCEVAGHEADIWFFGKNAALDFTGDETVALAINNVLDPLQGCAIMCDSSGNILLFTNGAQVFDRQQTVMPNGNNLHGDLGVTMPALIVPKPGDHAIYYIFTVDRPQIFPGDTTVWGLQYSEVNMTLNGGRGDVTLLKNYSLFGEVSEKISAVMHSNGRDIWVVSHRFDSDEFCAFLVTPDGVDTTGYVSSQSGSVHAGPSNTNNSVGFMKISPDGSRLALAVQGDGYFEIFDFDNSSGRVSNPIKSDNYSFAYGVEFSPDTRYLYATTAPYNGEPGFPSTLYQFDLSLGPGTFNSPVELAVNSDAEYFYGLQLGTDGRIYVARSPLAFDALGVIYNPKRPGTACNFNLLDGNAASLPLAGKRSRYGLPVFLQSYFDRPHFEIENVCFSDTTWFRLTNDANITSISWNFGDGTGAGNTSTEFEPTHVFSAPGDFTVSVTETYNGENYTYSEVVTVAELPAVQLGDTLYLYPGSTLLLDAGEGYQTYQWSTGETSQTIKIMEPGDFWVEVQDNRCCFNGDSVHVKIFDVLVPNAFRPGGANPVFKAKPTSGQAIENFAMYIYNRWGQLVFESRDIFEGWDGRFNGKDAPGDVYIWVINYDVAKETGTETITYKGNLVLLR